MRKDFKLCATIMPDVLAEGKEISRSCEPA